MSDTYLGRPRRVPEPKHFLSIDEVAHAWNCSAATVLNCIDSGALRVFKLTTSKHMWRIRRPDVEAGIPESAPQIANPASVAALTLEPAAPAGPPIGAVYFVKCAATGMIKIGFSTKPRSRVMGLQCGSAAALRLLALVPGAAPLEYEMHREFDAERARGEWFHPSADLLAFIKAMRKQHPLPAWAKEINA